MIQILFSCSRIMIKIWNNFLCFGSMEIFCYLEFLVCSENRKLFSSINYFSSINSVNYIEICNLITSFWSGYFICCGYWWAEVFNGKSDFVCAFQVILLSATMPNDVLEVTTNFMRNPIRILVKKEELTLEGIKQFYVLVEKEASGQFILICTMKLCVLLY